MTIAKLRAAGYTVRVQHRRNTETLLFDGDSSLMLVTHREITRAEYENETSNPQWRPVPWGIALQARGGKTVVSVTRPDTECTVTVGVQCHPNDNYCKKTGAHLGLQKAMQILFTRQERLKLMDDLCAEPLPLSS